MSRPPRRLARLLLALAWSATVAVFSSRAGGVGQTGGWFAELVRWLWPAATPAAIDLLHLLARRSAHVLFYGAGALAWRGYLATWPRLPAAPIAWGVVVVHAILDEWHQAHVPGRAGRFEDVLVDAAAAALALATLRPRPPQPEPPSP